MHAWTVGLSLGYTDLVILYLNHLRLSCQSATAFQHHGSANPMTAVCHGNSLQGDTEENTTGMGRRASRGEMMEGLVWGGEERQPRAVHIRCCGGKWVNMLDYNSLELISKTTKQWKVTKKYEHFSKHWCELSEAARLSCEQTPGCDPTPCCYTNTTAFKWDMGRKPGAPALLNCFLWPTMHFISLASITHTPTARHINTIIAVGAPHAVLHNDMSPRSVLNLNLWSMLQLNNMRWWMLIKFIS